MKKWQDEFIVLCKNKAYILLLALTAVCGYGYKVTHLAIGIDDTPYAYYFEEGLAAIVGRWVLFLLNKVVDIAQFAPFLTDLAAVLILMGAVTVWCALFRSILGEKLPMAGYCFFSAVFLSCPLISEVFTYYLHNGIAIGYLCCGLSLCMLREAVAELRNHEKKQMLKKITESVVFLCIALGCYESFMVVWLLGACLVFLTQRLEGKQKGMWKELAAAAGVAVCGMVLRSIMIALVTRGFGLQYLQEEAIQRSVTEMAGWLFEPGAIAELNMVLKRLFVMYGVFGYAYYPIKIFVLAAFVIVCCCVYRAIRNRDAWVVILCAGAFAVSFLLAIVEGKATLYRSAQFLPVICGYGMLLLVYACRGIWRRTDKAGKAGKIILVAVLSIILWNQCADLNRWFYVDVRKYENAKEMVARISYDLESGFDVKKPVVFTNTWEIPKGIIEDAYVDYGSETFWKMKRITDRVDEHLLEKFYRTYGVWVAQTPALSVIDWGRRAFDTDEELVRFFAMHGHELVPLLDTALYEEAEEASLDLPHYPQKGYIKDCGKYIIVHL